LKSIEFNGLVVTGEGNGKKYLTLSWVKSQILEKTGITPYPGTLNLKLTQKSIKHKRQLKEAIQIKICPPEGYCLGLLFKAKIRKTECLVVVPKKENYPEELLEVISPKNLRTLLKLKDGDRVTVSVPI
jgi:riboflavin kinase